MIVLILQEFLYFLNFTWQTRRTFYINLIASVEVADISLYWSCIVESNGVLLYWSAKIERVFAEAWSRAKSENFIRIHIRMHILTRKHNIYLFIETLFIHESAP